jgi:uncharacterized protein (DUF697 family)
MTQESTSANGPGERLLTAVERLVDDVDILIAQVEAYAEDVNARGKATGTERVPLQMVAERIIRSFSNRSAFAGGVTALPSMLPGGGTLLTLVGGSLADMTMMLKHEVELALCLTHLYGHDIREEKMRWLAYTLAAVNTYEVSSGRNFFVDVAEAQLEALSKYTPRQLSKLVITVLGKYALFSASRGLVRAIPFVGIAVSASANKLIVSASGWRCVDALERLRMAEGDEPVTVVDAHVL